MINRIARLVAAQKWEEALEALLAGMKVFRSQAAFGVLPLGWKHGDWLLRQLGDQVARLDGHGAKTEPPLTNSGRHVVVATTLYQTGGHTPLIADLIRALQSLGEVDAASCHIILTHPENPAGPESLPEALAALNLPPENFHRINETTLGGRLRELQACLARLCPRRAFLCHHADDVAAAAAALPQLAAEWYLLHHNDGAGSFGLFLPGVKVVSLSPRGAAFLRIQGVDSALLPLTVPDPGVRQGPFLQGGTLRTVTCGGPDKFAGVFPLSYPATVGSVLQAGHGIHTHIGPLDPAMVALIHREIADRGVGEDRFVHMAGVPSLSAFLLETPFDLFLASVPVAGLRTSLEVMATGTPHLWHALRPEDEPLRCQLMPSGGAIWRTCEDLSLKIQALSDPAVLADHGHLARRVYEEKHHPSRFARCLQDILHGGRGDLDEEANLRMETAGCWLVNGLVDAAMAQAEKSGELAARVKALKEELSLLREAQHGVSVRLEQWGKGTSLRARLRRWLLR